MQTKNKRQSKENVDPTKSKLSRRTQRTIKRSNKQTKKIAEL